MTVSTFCKPGYADMQEEVVAAVGQGSVVAEDDALQSDAEDDSSSPRGLEVSRIAFRR
jgi:hypothetical protein